MSNAGIESARLDAEVLLCHVLGIEKAELYVHLDAAIGGEREAQYRKLLSRRAQREPIAYITGRKEFWSLEFLVTPDALIPRPETELLVELALERATGLPIEFGVKGGWWLLRSNPPHPSLSPVVGGEDKREGAKESGTVVCFNGKSPVRILELGTGSGAIAVSLATQLPRAEICAVDISAPAIDVARLNARRHGVEERIEFLCGDLFEPAADNRNNFDLIVSNPPYVRRGDLASLAPEVREWEPITALDGGSDGRDFYRRIIPEVHDFLSDEGHVLLEIGDDMAEAVTQLFASAGRYQSVSVRRDYAGKDRVITATLKPPRARAQKGTNRG